MTNPQGKPLHTFIAVRDGIKNRRAETLTAAHRTSEKSDLYEGHTRTYRPKNDDGDQLPDENKNVQFNADTALNQLVVAVSDHWNLTASVDTGNQYARADVVVEQPDGTSRVVLEDVPATFLLFLARELDDVYKFIKSLPTLDPGARWHYDEAVAAYVSDPIESYRTQKTLRNHVLYEATERHPAQVQTFTEDKVVGYWTHTRRSGALSLERKTLLLQRVNALKVAVSEARERANQVDVAPRHVARAVFDYLMEEDR